MLCLAQFLMRNGQRHGIRDDVRGAWLASAGSAGGVVKTLVGLALFLVCLPAGVRAEPEPIPVADDPLVDITTVDKTILVELRYATSRNIAGRAIYPAGARCMVRRRVAGSLWVAQTWLRERGYGLKIWDAYRPPSAQQVLWDLTKNRNYVSAPDSGRSLHTWGVAVDVTLVDAKGKELKMPTDFDDFTPAAAIRYAGTDPEVAKNLSILQMAMRKAGFLGMRTEWWHFIGKDWHACKQVEEDVLLPTKKGR